MPKHYEWWRDGADLPTRDQLSYFKKFYTSREWWKLIPRFNDPSWGNFLNSSESFLSSDGNDTYVVFFIGLPANIRRLEPGG